MVFKERFAMNEHIQIILGVMLFKTVYDLSEL